MIVTNSFADSISLREQISQGILVEDLTCGKSGHLLVMRDNGNPACLSERSAEKLTWNIVNLFADTGSSDVEKILRINTDGDELLYVKPLNYYIHPIPDFGDYSLTIPMVKEAFDEWGELNRDTLRFVEVYGIEDADIAIGWVEEIEYEYPVSGITKQEILDIDGFEGMVLSEVLIDVGNYDCMGKFNLWNSDLIKNTLKHEIGHVLGLKHSSDENGLMFSPFDGEIVFDNLGYVIPQKIYGNYVGMDNLASQHERLISDIESLGNKINLLQEKYDKKLIQWENRFEPGMYGKSRQLEKDMGYLAADIDLLIEKQIPLVDQANLLRDELTCAHSFE